MADAAKKDRKFLTTPVFRVSFPNVFVPNSFEGGPPKYGITALWTPAAFTEAEKKLWQAMIALANEVSTETFKMKWSDFPANLKRPFRKGEEKPGLEGYGAGVIFSNMTSKQKPGLVDRDRNPILNQEDFYPGCYARATIGCYAYNNKGKGVAFGVNNIQKVRDGQSFSGRVDASEDFGDDLGDAPADAPAEDPFA